MGDAVKVKQAVPFDVHFLTIYPCFFSICQDKLCTMRTNSSFRKKNRMYYPERTQSRQCLIYL